MRNEYDCEATERSRAANAIQTKRPRFMADVLGKSHAKGGDSALNDGTRNRADITISKHEECIQFFSVIRLVTQCLIYYVGLPSVFLTW